MHIRGILSLVVLAGLATLSGWFLVTLESSLREDDLNGVRVPPLYMDHVRAIRMNIQGIREYVLTADHLLQLPDDQGTRVEAPRLEMLQDGRVIEWRLRAEQAWLAPDNDLIRLERNVTLTRPTTSGKQPLTVTTQQLWIHRQAGIVETAEAVHGKTPGGVIDAVGLKAHLHEEQLELLSNVRGSYEPPDL